MQSARVEFSPTASRRLTILHHQCAWCGVVQDGPFADQRLPLISSYSHVCCPDCRRAWLAEQEPRPRPDAQ